VKFSGKIFGLLIIFGIIFLALVLVGTYLDAIDSLNILVLFSPAKLGFGFMLGGIIFLPAGIVGVGRQYFKGHRRLFTVLAILFISPLIFVSFIFGCVSAVLMAPMFPLRSEITQVTGVDTSPLVLSLCVKAITSRNTRIDCALILDDNDTLVASYCNEEIMVKGAWTFEPICVLSAGSEITVTVDFNTTLPSGDYLVRLSSWHDNHGESPFTIP